MLVYYIQLFRDAYWPNGQLSAASEPPTKQQKLELRRKAKLALLRNIPGLFISHATKTFYTWPADTGEFDSSGKCRGKARTFVMKF